MIPKPTYRSDRPRFLSRASVPVLLVTLGLGLSLGSPTPSPAQEAVPGAEWSVVERPEELGYSSPKLAEAKAFADSRPTTAVMVVARGQVVAQWGRVDQKLPIHSIRKSLLSLLYGRQVELGTVALDDTLAELDIDDQNPPLDDAEKRATVQDLLTARSGVYHPANYTERGRAAQSPDRGSHPPGTFWYYNNWDFNALGTIYERAAGKTVFEAFQQELAEPLQMQDFELKDGRDIVSDASVHAAYTFNLTARDLARVGLLVLRGGRWGDQQVVPESWVAEATRPHTEAEYTLKWGYMFWIADHGQAYPGFDAGGPVVLMRGLGGHVVMIVPHLDLVVVHRVQSSMPNPANYVGARDLGRLMSLILAARTE